MGAPIVRTLVFMEGFTMLRIGLFVLAFSLAACSREPAAVSAAPEVAPPASTPQMPGVEAATAKPSDPIVAAARAQIGVTTAYDPAYKTLAYPNGDVPLATGVCSDVVVRAVRTAKKIDLQKAVHEDMAAAFAAYPKKWNLSAPDKNIDHRRVLNLMTYFKRAGNEKPATKNAADYLPGDIVAWDLNGKGLTHIGVVSDKKSSGGTPLILHNIGRGAEESDILFAYAILGHYRLP